MPLAELAGREIETNFQEGEEKALAQMVSHPVTWCGRSCAKPAVEPTSSPRSHRCCWGPATVKRHSRPVSVAEQGGTWRLRALGTQRRCSCGHSASRARSVSLRDSPGRVAERLNAAVLKTARRVNPVSGVRIPPLPFCCRRLSSAESRHVWLMLPRPQTPIPIYDLILLTPAVKIVAMQGAIVLTDPDSHRGQAAF